MTTTKSQKLPTGYQKVGRINFTRAKAARISAADILINDNHITHIANDHKKELEALHISAIDYVTMIVQRYDEIRKNKGNSILLVKTNPNKANDTITIELVLNIKYKFWEIRTAQPRSNLTKNKLLWSVKKNKPT